MNESGDALIRHDEEDEALGDITDEESTQSAKSSVYSFRQQYGRTYHAYKDGKYHRPNDESELSRLDLWNQIFLLVNDGKLYLAPLDPKAAHRVLDIGTGTGIWAIEMADAHESAEILGIDLSPSMPSWVPPNVKFEITDVEDEWTYKTPFTYIHSRYMAGSIKDWPRLIGQAFQHLEPGGWSEFADFDIDWYSQDGTLTEEHALRRYMIAASHGAPKITGRIFNPGHQLEQWMKDAGFVNVKAMKTILPIGTWPKDHRLKEIGLLNRIQLWEGLAGFSYRLFIDVLGWTREEIEVLMMEVRQDLKNRKIHPMFDMYTVWGQRPV